MASPTTQRSRFAVLVLLLVMLAGANYLAGNDVAVVHIAPEDEPGTPLRISGVVKARDTGRPVGAAPLRIYHADALGLYSKDGADDDNPRLSLDLVTDSDGRFEVATIRPGSYQNTRSPQHVHYVIDAPGYGRIYGEIMFDDDPFVTEATREHAEEEGDEFVIVTPRITPQGIAICEVTLWIGNP